jgi:hypothetical protein
VIPAVIALWFRLTIIESPRYTADVSGDTAKAASELKRYLLKSHEIGLVSATAVTVDNVAYSHPRYEEAHHQERDQVRSVQPSILHTQKPSHYQGDS